MTPWIVSWQGPGKQLNIQDCFYWWLDLSIHAPYETAKGFFLLRGHMRTFENAKLTHEEKKSLKMRISVISSVW